MSPKMSVHVSPLMRYGHFQKEVVFFRHPQAKGPKGRLRKAKEQETPFQHLKGETH